RRAPAVRSRRDGTGRSPLPMSRVSSKTGDAVLPIQGVDADARNLSPVHDARQLGAAGARHVHGAEGPPGVDEAVSVAGGVAVDAGDLPDVADAEGDRAGGERKVEGSEHAGSEQKAV